MKTRTVPAAKAKAQLLSLLDEVARTREELIVTKRGRPVARIVPIKRRKKPVAQRARILGDIVSPIDVGWELG